MRHRNKVQCRKGFGSLQAKNAAAQQSWGDDSSAPANSGSRPEPRAGCPRPPRTNHRRGSSTSRCSAIAQSSGCAVPYAASMLRQITASMTFETRGRGLLEVTGRVADWVAESGLSSGLLSLFVRHTSASLLIQENADPDVRGDLERFFARLVPDGDPLFRHRD